MAAVIAACSAPSEHHLLVDSIPTQIAMVAVLGIDADGALTGASGLAPVRADRVLTFAELPGADRFEVLGYTQAALDARGPLPSEEVLRATALRAATPTDAQLPAPAWHLAFDDAGAAVDADPPPPALTAAWLPPCPFHVPARTGVAVSCAFQDCTARVEQTGCRLRFDASACASSGLGTLDVDIGANGALTPRGDSHFSACAADPSPPPGVAIALSCREPDGEPCVIEAHTSSAPPAMTVDTLALAPGARIRGDLSRRPPDGFVTGLVVRDEVALVARTVATPWPWDACPPERSGVFELIALDSLEVRTATAPPCVMRMAPDPTGDGALFLTGGPQGTIGRVNAQGEVTQQVALAELIVADGHLPVRLFTVERPAQIWILLTRSLGSSGATIARLGLQDLRPLGPPVVDRRQRIDVIGAGLDGAVSVVGDGRDDLHALTANGELGPVRALFNLCSRGFGVRPSMLWAHDASRLLVLPAIDSDSPTAYLLDERDGCRAVAYPWGEADAYAAVAWPPDPERVLVGLEIAGRAELALLDPRGARFVGGGRVVGEGPIDGPAVDRRGRVWMLLPWTATVLRLTPD